MSTTKAMQHMDTICQIASSIKGSFPCDYCIFWEWPKTEGEEVILIYGGDDMAASTYAAGRFHACPAVAEFLKQTGATLALVRETDHVYLKLTIPERSDSDAP